MEGIDFGWIMNALAEPWPPAASTSTDRKKPPPVRHEGEAPQKDKSGQDSIVKPKLNALYERPVDHEPHGVIVDA